MSTTTENLKLYKYDLEADKNKSFNITKALNDNWDKIDEFAASLNTNLPVFCFNSGPVDENGEPALLTLSDTTITQHAPSVCTTADGETIDISEDVTTDISELLEGEYNIFYNPESKNLEIYKNKIYIQKSQPSDMQTNDIWVDTSIMPYKAKKKNTNGLQNTKLVPNAVISIVSGGG